MSKDVTGLAFDAAITLWHSIYYILITLFLYKYAEKVRHINKF
jgi:hypothetical protein